jgi:hypothetical protein
MSEPFERGLGAIDAGGCHDGVHGAPAGHARPGPQADPTALATAGVQLADAVHEVERIEQGRGGVAGVKRYHTQDELASTGF